MKKYRVIDSAVTFMCWRTYLFARDTRKGDIPGCPGYLCNKKNALLLLRG